MAKKHECWKTKIVWDITLRQAGRDNFEVQYGAQIDSGLSYSEACSKLGQAVMHALSCEDLVDNRAKGER